MLIDEIATYLQTGGVGTIGTNIFIGFQPPDSEARNCITIKPTGGLAPDVDLIGITNPTVQILGRGATISEAMALSQAAYNILHGLANTDIGDNYIMFCEALQEPTAIGQDDNNNFEISCNYLLKVR